MGWRVKERAKLFNGLREFRDWMQKFRVFDPGPGLGNFLFFASRAPCVSVIRSAVG